MTIKTVIDGSGGISYNPPLKRYYQAIGLPCDSYTHTDYLFADAGGQVYTADEHPDGDPAADVTFYDFGDSAKTYREDFSYTAGNRDTATFEYTVTAMAHEITFGEGYCYQFRPVYFMPVRIDALTVSIIRNDGHTADITDNLIAWELLADGETIQKGESKILSWKANMIGPTGTTTQQISAVRPYPRMCASIINNGKAILVNYRNFPEGMVNISIVNMIGRELYRSNSNITGEGKQVLSIPCNIASGIYYVILRCKNIALKDKVVFFR
ncbi:hypothetical protein ACFL5S_00670 [Fibrobacterota bacterium]